MSITIALAGNPNCGKSTLFNALTGSNQYVGNWPGVTVEKKGGVYKKDKEVNITDLPGIYSLSPYTLEEVVSREYLINEKPDVIVDVMDASNIERNLYLATQLSEIGIPMVLALNMMDVVEKNGDKIDTDKLSQEFGYPVVEISALRGKNIDKVMTAMEGKTCVVSGHSGSGKSTLINAIDPELHLKTAAISEQHLQGQHTTTFAEMFDLPNGARIIDTPGIRGFGMVEIEKEELTDYFPEFFALKHHCKFHNCLHTDEPQCAIKEALEEGTIAWSRYKSYLQILNGEEDR